MARNNTFTVEWTQTRKTDNWLQSVTNDWIGGFAWLTSTGWFCPPCLIRSPENPDSQAWLGSWVDHNPKESMPFSGEVTNH
jgi:hypothetical protein